MTQYPDDIDAPQSPQRHPAAGLDGSPAAESGDALDNSAEESVNGSMKSQSLSAAAAEPIGLLARELMPKRAVSYLRVSTREQAERGGREEGFSIPAQRAANKRKAQTIGAVITKEFVERGVSGTSTRRPALQAMLRYLEDASADGETIDYVIVHKLDRLARNRADDVALNQRFDDLGIRLISTSENIDQTPGGMLLHGIMSSIAEFYSLNLSNEVKKGMGEKARNGGCIGRAPVGYRNTTVDTDGGQAHIAALDPERADLVSWAFTAYATGDYTLKSLAAELNSRGLTVPATARLPERPISIQSLHRLLSNPFYTGQVTYRGALYPGTHQPLTDAQTFQRVQAVLSSKVNGERTIRHPHYLKSTVYCGICGSRLIITEARPKQITYQYFVCLGRHSKKHPECTFRATLTDLIEDEVEGLYQQIQLPPERRQTLEQALRHQLAVMVQDTAQQLRQLTATRRKLEHQQSKLLQAHYEDAISLDVLKREQHRITRSLNTTTQHIEALEHDLEDKEVLITQALDLAQHTATAYHQAPDHIRRMLNQLFFDHVYLVPDQDTNQLTTTATCLPPFDSILRWRATDDVEGTEGAVVERRKSEDAEGAKGPALGNLGETKVTGDEGPASASGAMGRAGPATADEVERDDEVGTTDLVAPRPAHITARSACPDSLEPAETGQNTPVSIQKPTSWDDHDVGLSVVQLVGVAGFEPTTSSSRTKRATKLRHTPCAAQTA